MFMIFRNLERFVSAQASSSKAVSQSKLETQPAKPVQQTQPTLVQSAPANGREGAARNSSQAVFASVRTSNQARWNTLDG